MGLYYVGGVPYSSDELYHSGRKGMKWGKHIFGEDDAAMRYAVQQRNKTIRGKVKRVARPANSISNNIRVKNAYKVPDEFTGHKVTVERRNTNDLGDSTTYITSYGSIFGGATKPEKDKYGGLSRNAAYATSPHTKIILGKGTWSQAKDEIDRSMRNGRAWVRNRIDDIDEIVSDASKDVANWAVNTGKAIGDTASKAGKAVGKAATEAGKAVGKAAKDASNWASNTAKDVGKAATDAGKTVGKAASKAGKAIGDTASKAAKDVSDWGGKQVNKGKKFLKSIFG